MSVEKLSIDVTEEDIEKAKEAKKMGWNLSYCCPVTQALKRQYPPRVNRRWRTTERHIQKMQDVYSDSDSGAKFTIYEEEYVVPKEIEYIIQAYDADNVMDPVSFEAHLEWSDVR